jgi:hypothetical protein
MSLNFDFSDVSYQRPPSQGGVFDVKITEVSGYTSTSGNARISVVGLIEDGPEKGCTIKDGINCPKSADDGVKRVWMKFFVCLGLDPDEVSKIFCIKAKDKPTVDIIADTVRENIVGRNGFCHYMPPVEEGGWPERKWKTAGQAKAVSDLAAASAALADSEVDPLDAMINV